MALDRYVIAEPSRTRTIHDWLSYFTRDRLVDELAEHGFAVRESYSDVAGAAYDAASPEYAVIAMPV